MASIKGHFLNWNFVSNVTEGLTTVKKSNLHRFIVLAIIKEAPLEKKQIISLIESQIVLLSS